MNGIKMNTESSCRCTAACISIRNSAADVLKLHLRQCCRKTNEDVKYKKGQTRVFQKRNDRAITNSSSTEANRLIEQQPIVAEEVWAWPEKPVCYTGVRPTPCYTTTPLFSSSLLLLLLLPGGLKHLDLPDVKKKKKS